MGELHGLYRRADADEIRAYRRDVAKAKLGKHGFSWFEERLPPVVVERLCWDAFEAGQYDDTRLEIGSDPELRDAPYEQVLDALDDAAEQAADYADSTAAYLRHGGPLYDRVYEERVDDLQAEMDAITAAIDDHRRNLHAWWDVTDAWLDAAEQDVERLYSINPFEAERREQELAERRQYHAALDPDLLDARYPAHQLGQRREETKRERDWQMVGCVKGGTMGGIISMALGAPVLGAAIATVGPLFTLAPWITRQAEMDAFNTVRASYRVEEMDRVLDAGVVDTVERPGTGQ